MLRKFGFASIAAVLMAIVPQVDASSAAPSAPVGHEYATYHGRTIDLAVSWEGAQACAIGDAGNQCFDSEAEMNASLATRGSVQIGPVTVTADVSALLACSPSLKLYDSTGFSGSMVNITQRLSYIPLSSVGFSARTSSYIVGGCNSTMYDSASAVYPGYTGAGGAAASMASGWNNRVTAVYIS